MSHNKIPTAIVLTRATLLFILTLWLVAQLDVVGIILINLYALASWKTFDY